MDTTVDDKKSGHVKKTKLVIMGGFLGSGKTTLMVSLGRRDTESFSDEAYRCPS